MARKKTVSISIKSSADNQAAAEPVEPGEQPALSPLAMTLQPYAEIPVTEPAPVPVPESLHLGPVGKVVYGTVFCVSYGVVFSVILVGQLIPGSRIIGHALCDGAGAARRTFGG